MWVDIPMAFLVIFLIYRGGAKGFMRSLFTPVCFWSATYAALVYYETTKNVNIAFAIGILGPLVLYWILILVLKGFDSMTGGEVQPNVLSRMLGSVINVIWGVSLALPIVFVLGIMPPVYPGGTAINPKVTASGTFALTKKLVMLLKLPLPTVTPAPNASGSLSPEQAEVLAQDPQIQELLKDPEIQKAVQEKNYMALMTNPKLVGMAETPTFVQKFLAAYSAPPKTQEVEADAQIDQAAPQTNSETK